MIIFNEKKYVEEKILPRSGKITNNKELLMFIRYYSELNQEMDEIWELANIKADKLEAVYDTIADIFLFNDAYKKAIKRKQYVNEPISISKCEYDWIRQVNDVEKEKVLFTLLIIQRFLKLEFIKITYKDLRMFALTKRQPDALRRMIDELQRDGFLKRITDKTYGVIGPECNGCDEYITVMDYNHITAPYLRTLKTKEYFYCEWCGTRVKYKDEADAFVRRAKVFCDKCSTIPHKDRMRS